MNETRAPAAARPAAAPDGVVLLDKPVGLSSNAALQRVKRLFGARKAGHTGSLDPLASGLLPICLGQATRFSGYLLDALKGYEVEGRLGARTATGDAEGEVVESRAWEHVDRAGFEQALAGFRGPIRQVPPMYSALKQGGERLYRKARRGEEVTREARPVEIYRLELGRWQPPAFSLRVDCSKGTYVRTLVEDIAAAAGTCGHVTALRRVRAGPFEADGMHTLEELGELAAEGEEALAAVVLAADAALPELPVLALPAEDVRRLRCGQELEGAVAGRPGPARAYGPEGFVGVVERDAAGKVRARRLLSTADEQLR